MDSSLRDSVAVTDPASAPHAPGACRMLERGAAAPSARALAGVIREIAAGTLPEVARDRNAICHRALLADRRGFPRPVIVKSPRLGPQRTNPDATFAGEAQILAQLPALGIGEAPQLIARVVVDATHFLFVSELPGKHPDPRKHPLDAAQFRAIVDALQTMDRLGFMHYDLKAGNVLTDGPHAAFIDFEFARVGAPWDADAPAEPSFDEDFNVANNPFVRARSNVVNFEFRCLHRYLVDAGTTSPNADDLFRAWLIAKAPYHERMAQCLSGRAATHERRLASLLRDPPAAIIRIERLLIAYRTAVFERDARDAGRTRRAIRAAIAKRHRRGDAVPRWYADSAARIVARVARSTHPAS